MSELVSVIVPVYNIEAYLPRCLECIKSQTYKNLEIILVDDGSTDSSGRICEEYAASDTRARVIHHDHNSGLWAARNTGQEAASGEYLWFPDGDDYYHTEIVRLMVEASYFRGSRYDIVLVDAVRTNSLEYDIYSKVNVSSLVISQDLLMSHLIQGDDRIDFLDGMMWNKLFRREIIENLRTNNYKRSQDWDFCFRAYLRVKQAVIIQNVLYYWYNRSDSLMNTPDYHHIYCLCRVDMYYDNYKNIPCDSVQFGNRILWKLYKLIVAYEEEVYGKREWHEMVEKCRDVIKDTWKSYLSVREIPFSERIVRLFLACNPRISHLLFKVRKQININKVFRQ